MTFKLLNKLHRRKLDSLSKTARSISITCRGSAIPEEDLFRYTNGRFLVAEDFQCRRRYLKFNVQKLCDVAAALGNPSPVIQIDKTEGGFSKAMLIKREDGREFIAKLPCPNAGLSYFTTASEVAVLQFVRSQTTVPVPRVLAWSSSPSNPVEAEYILMEKATGTQLFQKWDDLDGDSRLSLIKQLTEIEHELASIHFPASGHLYLRESILKDSHILLNSTVDPTSHYAIARSCGRSWEIDQSKISSNLFQKLDPGPWKSVAAYGRALAYREIQRLRNQLSTRPYIEDDIALLKRTADIIEKLPLEKISQPALWHTDLHMEPPSDYVRGFVHPELPSNFESMEDDDKELAMYKFKQASRTKAYETSTFLKNRNAYYAMNVPGVFRELFIRCGEVLEKGAEPLRACLIEISQSWEQFKLPGTCPFSFTPDEIIAHEAAFKDYEELHQMQKFAMKYLDTDSEGWIAPAINFEEKQAQNKALFEYYLENLAHGKSREELLRLWPFTESVV